MNQTLSLFRDIVVDAPETEGIKYAGSKLKLLPQILDLAKKTGAKTVLDGFAGTTRVSQAFAKSGYRVVSSDVSIWSEIFATCYLLNRKPRSSYIGLIDHLNSLEPKDGWFTQNYGGAADIGTSSEKDGLKKPWQTHNTRKLDAIREEIDRLCLPPVDRAVAITSLILALDKVDSTMGHFVSYLKDWSPRSFNRLRLEVPMLFENDKEHYVKRGDIFDAANLEVDLAYYDPPYGSNNEKMPPSRIRYNSYYHLWTTVCKNDKPELFGKAMRRADSSDTITSSVFEEFRKNPITGRFLAVEAIEKLIQRTSAKWIILSYSSGGRATAEELNSAIEENGELVEVIKTDYKRNVMAGMRWTNDWIREVEGSHKEFIFLIKKHQSENSGIAWRPSFLTRELVPPVALRRSVHADI